MYRARAKLEESFSELWSQQFDRGCTLNGGCDVVVKQLKPRSTLSCDGAKLPTRLKVKCAKCVKQADVIRISKHILLDECFPWGIYLNCAQNATSTHIARGIRPVRSAARSGRYQGQDCDDSGTSVP